MRLMADGSPAAAVEEGRVLIYGDPDCSAAIERELQRFGMPSSRLAEVPAGEGGEVVLLVCRTPGREIVGLLGEILGKAPEALVIVVAESMPAELGGELLGQGLADVVLMSELYRLPPLIRRHGHALPGTAWRPGDFDAAAMLDSLPAMIGYWDRDQRNRFANREYRAWFGLDPAWMVGRHLSEILGERLYRLNLPHIEAVLRGEPQCFERAIPTADGGVRHSQAHYIPDLHGGVVHGFYVMVSDVSPLKRAEAAWQASEKRLRAVFDILPVGIVLTDPAGRLVECNQAACGMFGIERADCLARSLAGPEWCFRRADGSILPAEESPALQALRQGRVLHDVEVEYVAPGRQCWLSVSAMPVGLPEYGVIVAFADISGRRRLEEERREMRRQIEKMAQEQVAYQALAGLAHAFNQPLSALAFYLENALKQLQGGRPEAAKLEAILSSGTREVERAGKVLKELLRQLYRPRTDTAVIDLNDMVASCVQKILVGLGNGCRVTLQLPDSAVWVKVNAQQMELILENLLRNSCEALSNCGDGDIAVTVTVADGMARVGVSDNGPGVPKDLERRIYEPFFSTKEECTGMGLAISRTLVEAQGGKLWHEADGCGVKFSFTVPLAR